MRELTNVTRQRRSRARRQRRMRTPPPPRRAGTASRPPPACRLSLRTRAIVRARAAAGCSVHGRACGDQAAAAACTQCGRHPSRGAQGCTPRTASRRRRRRGQGQARGAARSRACGGASRRRRPAGCPSYCMGQLRLSSGGRSKSPPPLPPAAVRRPTTATRGATAWGEALRRCPRSACPTPPHGDDVRAARRPPRMRAGGPHVPGAPANGAPGVLLRNVVGADVPDNRRLPSFGSLIYSGQRGS